MPKITEGRLAYEMVRSELSYNNCTIKDIDPDVAAVARQFAKASHKKWPPRPYPWYIEGGWHRHGQ